MTKKAQAIYDEVQNVISGKSLAAGIKGSDYYDLLCEISGHIQCLMDCYREEHPEEFE